MLILSRFLESGEFIKRTHRESLLSILAIYLLKILKDIYQTHSGNYKEYYI
jgi:hypothetical protein